MFCIVGRASISRRRWSGIYALSNIKSLQHFLVGIFNQYKLRSSLYKFRSSLDGLADGITHIKESRIQQQ